MVVNQYSDKQLQLVKNFYKERYDRLLSDAEIVEICQNLISLAKAVVLYSLEQREGGSNKK